MANELENETGADERRLSEADARRLLERAIQLDAARSGETSVSELRRVAQELNVSPAAFAEALRELENKAVTAPFTPPLNGPAASTSPALPGKRSWWRTFAIGVAGFLMGASPLAPVPPWNFANGIGFARPLLDPGSILLLAASVYLMTYHRRRGTASDFQRDLLALWGAVGVGSFLAGSLWTPALYVLAFGWLGYSAIGGYFIRRKPPEPTP
jgi:hypothetical protein